MHKYRTHKCHELRIENVQDSVKLSGWVHRKRDHGQLIFIDLRDHYGLTQVVVDSSNKNFSVVENVSLESVITISGTVVERSEETINKNLPTGNIEVNLSELKIISKSNTLPLQVNSDEDYGEETRLKYRYLDLRRSRPHSNIILRSNVIQTIRNKMLELGFLEFQTPILTASSPEGARDFLVPSRLNKGKFYALPQAPQQFKQLIMVSGFDKYFQIAPCFRDEDSRADRSPGEFYQLDLEMSYVEQEDVFHAVEPVIREVFTKFSNRKIDAVFPKIVVTDTTKTQYLFRINKGKEDLSDNINNHMPEDKRPIPFDNMIYVGDGLTDVPSMALIKKEGGHSIAVYQKKLKAQVNICKELFEANRVDFISEADFTKDSDLYRKTCLLLDFVVAKIRYTIELKNK